MQPAKRPVFLLTVGCGRCLQTGRFSFFLFTYCFFSVLSLNVSLSSDISLSSEKEIAHVQNHGEALGCIMILNRLLGKYFCKFGHCVWHSCKLLPPPLKSIPPVPLALKELN